MATRVSEAMNRAVVTVPSDVTIAEAVALARETGADHLLVVDADVLVGILCGCDLRAAEPDEVVADRMTVPVLTLRPEDTLDEAALTLCECGVGCLPVTVGGLILGTVSEVELEHAGIHARWPHRRCHHDGREASSPA